MNWWRGVIAGLVWAAGGLAGIPAMIFAGVLISWWSNGTNSIDRQYDILWWKERAFPGIVAIPMLLFFTGFVTAVKGHYCRFLKNFALLTAISLPLTALLGEMGMAHTRYKSIEHPPIYFSEILMFLLPQLFVSFVLLATGPNPASENDSHAGEARQPKLQRRKHLH